MRAACYSPRSPLPLNAVALPARIATISAPHAPDEPHRDCRAYRRASRAALRRSRASRHAAIGPRCDRGRDRRRRGDDRPARRHAAPLGGEPSRPVRLQRDGSAAAGRTRPTRPTTSCSPRAWSITARISGSRTWDGRSASSSTTTLKVATISSWRCYAGSASCSRDAVLTVNVYYLFTFVAVSLAAWFVLRRLGVSRPRRRGRGDPVQLPAVPLRAGRGAPAAVGLLHGPGRHAAHPAGAVATTHRSRRARDSPEPRWRVAVCSRRAVPWLLACAALGSTGPVLRVLRGAAPGRRRRHRPRGAAEPGGARPPARSPSDSILVVLLLNLSPSFLYWLSHGQNPTTRSPRASRRPR